MEKSLQRLPRGRHGMTREQVAALQRGRMLRALAEAMAERGYVDTSVADVLRRAGTSRETFYEQFSSKQACFIAAYELAAGRIVEKIEREAAAAGSPAERFERALGGYLDALAAEPEFARLFMVEVYAAGEQALAARAEVQQRFVDLVSANFGVAAPEDRFACEAFVAAAVTLVTGRLTERDIEGLLALRAPMTELARVWLTARGHLSPRRRA